MQTAATPPRIMGLYDRPFWDQLEETGRMHLQCCSDCSGWRYPPGPACPACLSARSEWKPVTGKGEVLSWIIFRKTYLPQYEAPYNVIAVRLQEGPTVISNLVEDPPEGESPIGRLVRLKLVRMDDGVPLPRFEFDDQSRERSSP